MYGNASEWHGSLGILYLNLKGIVIYLFDVWFLLLLLACCAFSERANSLQMTGHYMCLAIGYTLVYEPSYSHALCMLWSGFSVHETR